MRKPFIIFSIFFQIFFTSGQSLKAKTTRLHIESKISLRYAQTRVESEMENPDSSAQEITFSMILPETAFISNFSMILNDVETVAKVMEKQEAIDEYNEAKRIGISSGLVKKERYSNRFSMSANVEARGKVVFLLTYEELLERSKQKYHHNINIFPDGDLEDVKVEIFINESLPLSSLNVTELKDTEDAEVTWTRGSSEAHILFQPSELENLKGQLSIEYDVERGGQESEVQVIDGYFVHFFTDDKLKTLPKHVVFVLDVSGSMRGTRLEQLKEAMLEILDDMEEEDFFSIITFSSSTKTWRLPGDKNDSLAAAGVLKATGANLLSGQQYVNSLTTRGSTNINSALLEALKQVGRTRQSGLLKENIAPMIWFLTDGQATIGETISDNIKRNVKENNPANVPILGLAFGSRSDFQLIKDISAQTDSLARRIYEGSDAAIQLEDFYDLIKSPILSNVNFEYVGNSVEKSSLSQTLKYQMYSGGEYVVVGKITNTDLNFKLKIYGDCSRGLSNQHCSTGQYEQDLTICPRCQVNNFPARSQAQQFMKKLYAFKNIQQLLKLDTASSKIRAKELSLENNFVTDLTSLVIPNQRDEDVRVANLGETSRTSQQDWGQSRMSQNYAYAGIQTTSLQFGPRSGSGRSRGRGGRPRGRGGSRSVYKMSGSSSRSRQSYSKTGNNYNTSSTTTRRPTTTTTTATTSTTITPEKISSNCSITLYEAEYHSGQQILLTENVSDLSVHNFEDKVYSVKVDGWCKWIIFSGKNYNGYKQEFLEGENYVKRTDLGRLYQNAKSIRMISS